MHQERNLIFTINSMTDQQLLGYLKENLPLLKLSEQYNDALQKIKIFVIDQLKKDITKDDLPLIQVISNALMLFKQNNLFEITHSIILSPSIIQRFLGRLNSMQEKIGLVHRSGKVVPSEASNLLSNHGDPSLQAPLDDESGRKNEQGQKIEPINLDPRQRISAFISNHQHEIATALKIALLKLNEDDSKTNKTPSKSFCLAVNLIHLLNSLQNNNPNKPKEETIIHLIIFTIQNYAVDWALPRELQQIPKELFTINHEAVLELIMSITPERSACGQRFFQTPSSDNLSSLTRSTTCNSPILRDRTQTPGQPITPKEPISPINM